MDLTNVSDRTIHVIKARRRARLAALLDEHGKVKLSKLVDISADYLWQMGKGTGKSARGISDDNARKIETHLGEETGWMDRPTDQERSNKRISSDAAQPLHPDLSRDPRVRVMGTAIMDKEGFWTDLVDDPEGNGYFSVLTDDPEAYYIRIRGGVATPLAMSGWYILLLPGMPPAPGSHVLVALADGRNMVKEFLWHRDGEYALQAGDGTRMLLPEGEVDHIHTMAGTMMPTQLKR